MTRNADFRDAVARLNRLRDRRVSPAELWKGLQGRDTRFLLVPAQLAGG